MKKYYLYVRSYYYSSTWKFLVPECHIFEYDTPITPEILKELEIFYSSHYKEYAENLKKVVDFDFMSELEKKPFKWAIENLRIEKIEQDT